MGGNTLWLQHPVDPESIGSLKFVMKILLSISLSVMTKPREFKFAASLLPRQLVLVIEQKLARIEQRPEHVFESLVDIAPLSK